MNQERLIGTAKKLDKLLKIVQIVNCAAVIFLLCGFLLLNIAYWVNPENVNRAGLIKVAMGEFALEMTYEAGIGLDLAYGWANCIFVVILLIILWIGFHYARKIIVPMMAGNPFDHSVSDCFKKLSYISLVYGTFGNFGSMVMTFMKMKYYQLERIVDGKQILSVTPEYQLELGFLVVFFVFLLASYIFHYGAELQQLSDETL